MPFQSDHPPIDLPPVDIWDFLFERPAREFPEDHVISVDVAAQKSQTFREIRHAGEQFGRGLQERWRWQKSDVMALFTPNTTDIMPVTFGTLWAGGVVCPFNNLYTVGELVAQLKSSRAKGLTTHVACLDVAREAALLVGLPLDRIILVGRSDPKGRFQHYSDIKSTSNTGKKAQMNPKEDLAFLVYSSGTTGLPKGVMLTHENIVANLIQGRLVESDLTSWRTDRTIGFLPMYHIYGIAVLILAPLYRGITVHVMQRFDLEQFCSVVQESKITIAYVVPPVVLLLAKHPLVGKYNLSSLRIMHSSAAPLANDLVDMVYKRLKVPIKQGYGLSEASPGVATQAWGDWNKFKGSAGNLLPSMSIKFMDNGKEVPVNEQGEIWIHGPNIFKGYYNNPKATAECFNSEGWYRTGDIGYIDEAKNIYITDRAKELIKYNGFQVAPAQLEGLLLAHPAVNDVAVIGVYSEEKATELPRAYVVPAKGYQGSSKLEKEVSEWFHQRVARYKRLRGGIRFVTEIPKSAAGKVLRRVLAEQARNEAKKDLKARL